MHVKKVADHHSFPALVHVIINSWTVKFEFRVDFGHRVDSPLVTKQKPLSLFDAIYLFLGSVSG